MQQTETGVPGGPTKGPKPNQTTINVTNPDMIQDRLLSGLNWAERNAKYLAALLVLVLLVLAGKGIYEWMQERNEVKAQDAFYAVETKYNKIREDFDRAKMQGMMPAVGKDAAAAVGKKPSGDLAADYGTVVGDLEKIARDQEGTTAGAQASILSASLYLEYKQPDKAIELANLAVSRLNAKHIFAPLSSMVLGNAMATKGDCNGAVGVWQKVLDNTSAKHLHADASLRSGLCYETLNQNDKAAEMYRRVSTDSENSSAAQTARGLLRALEARTASAPQPSQG